MKRDELLLFKDGWQSFLNKKRLQAGFTYRSLAAHITEEHSPLTYQGVWNAFNDESNVTYEKLSIVCEALEVDINDLLEKVKGFE